ncbi:MAG: hypothetical protein B6U69_00870 [Thermofilum sp. ex4484_15]|nr:MAG: hypothetical protein B6U69_00870 [Thermofilum sp. ex4484_15]
MSIRVFEGFKFKPKGTYFYKLDPRVKMSFLIVYSILTLYFSTVVPLSILFLFSVVIVVSNRVAKEWGRTLRAVALLSLVIFSFNLLFGAKGNKLNYASSMTLRFLTLTSFFSIFFLTTTPEELSEALLLIGIPYEYTFMFMMAMRFIPTLARDFQTIIDAQRSRGLELEKGNFVQRARKLLPLLIPLIVLEIRRSVLIAEALEARGFGTSAKRSTLKEYRLSKVDLYLLFLTITFATSLILSSKLPPYSEIMNYRLPELVP